jgi:Putative beta-lactamase-inhibitor-like, PepSY-like
MDRVIGRPETLKPIIMTKRSLILLLLSGAALGTNAQKLDSSRVPAVVRNSFNNRFPYSSKLQWEKESGAYEAGFKRGPQNISVLFTPKGQVIEIEANIPISSLPATVRNYVKAHYKEKIKEAARITKSGGEINYEAEVAGTDRLFDESGNYLKSAKD